MRIAYLAAGAAGMYCGSCLHDNTLAAALLKLGEDVFLAPIYTPIRTDETDVSEHRVFIGGLNAYLQQKIPLLRRTPRWMDRWLDGPRVLNLLAGRGSSVDAAKLGPMTVSMLQGEMGNQRKEIDYAVDWLVEEIRPDVIHLSNAMMIGLARSIVQRGGPPVVCSLSGEDVFLERLRPPHYEQARCLLSERAADIAAFVALNRYYADFMTQYMRLTADRVHVIHHGLDLEGHGSRQRLCSAEAVTRIGYLARICEDKGLHLLVEACEILAERDDVPAFELHAAGYLGASDKPYFAKLRRRIDAGPLAHRFTYHGELDRAQKIEFLQSLGVFSTPTIYRESKGLPILEAWANGAPAVVPDHGTFPELIESTGAGLLHQPGDARDLSRCLAELLCRPDKAAQLGDLGRKAVLERFHAEQMARQTLSLYQTLVKS